MKLCIEVKKTDKTDVNFFLKQPLNTLVGRLINLTAGSRLKSALYSL